jgi:hypothetical protein
LYEEGGNDQLPQAGASDPVAGASFVVLDEPVVIPESDGSTPSNDPILGESGDTDLDTQLPDAIATISTSEHPETIDALINPGHEAIEDAELVASNPIEAGRE